MHLFINSLAASAGGGVTYICNVVPQLAAAPNLRISVALGKALRRELPKFDNVDFIEFDASAIRRFWFEQFMLPGLVQNCHADVVLSTGNIALRKSPVPQILLSRNSLYTSADFYKDVLRRADYRTWLATRVQGLIARKSIGWADTTVAPSEAFAAELRQWTGKPHILAIYHGFDRAAFTRDAGPISAEIEEKLKPTEGSLRLLFVSHYNYYRNFETIIRALPRLRERLTDRKVRLILTCRLIASENPGSYRPEAAAKLIRELGVAEMVVELGAIPYHQLHHLYRRADIYVTAAYAETFAHPLVEAMSSGLPVVASDLPVHKEICEDAAVYFPRFSPEDLAERVAEVATEPDAAARKSANGIARAAEFSWKKHAEELLGLAHSLLGAPATALGQTRRVPDI